MRADIVALAARPSPNSKTTRILQSILDAIKKEQTAITTYLGELSTVADRLRVASCRTEMDDLSRNLLDAIEQASVFVVGVSMKPQTGYPALLRHMFEMADPTLLAGKPIILVKSHCNTQNHQPSETELEMFLSNFGFALVSEFRLTSTEMLTGLSSGDRRLELAIESVKERFAPTYPRLVSRT